MKATHLLLLIAVLGLNACAAKRTIPFRAGPGEPFTGKMGRYDYTTYAHIPDTPTSWLYRRVLKIIPHTRRNAFWGNWAGSGNAGGPPKDEMDEIFRRHDIAYAESNALKTMKWADEACVEALHRMDQSKMSPEGIAFYNRSAGFFSNPWLVLVGKPVSSYWQCQERKDSPFQSKEDLRALFKLPPHDKAAASR